MKNYCFKSVMKTTLWKEKYVYFSCMATKINADEYLWENCKWHQTCPSIQWLTLMSAVITNVTVPANSLMLCDNIQCHLPANHCAIACFCVSVGQIRLLCGFL